MKIINEASCVYLTIVLLAHSTNGGETTEATEATEPEEIPEEGITDISAIIYPNDPAYPDQNDLFFNRTVAISLFEDDEEIKNIAIGVLLDEFRVLTSFNPFREHIKNKGPMRKIKLTFLSNTGNYLVRHIECARPLIPMEDKQILDEQWHGLEKKHCPLHDLAVLRTDISVIMVDPEPTTTIDPEQEGATTDETINKAPTTKEVTTEKPERRVRGPLMTTVGYQGSNLMKTLTFVSLGLTNHEPIDVYKTLRFAVYDIGDREDCDSWLPKNWGIFICLKNDPKFIGFGSSAMLYSNEVLFGVGSFTFYRGESSILVFTDVRPYNDLIQNTCTDDDLTLLRRIHG